MPITLIIDIEEHEHGGCATRLRTAGKQTATLTELRVAEVYVEGVKVAMEVLGKMTGNMSSIQSDGRDLTDAEIESIRRDCEHRRHKT